MYALGTLQSFVENYYRAIERINVWKNVPDAKRELIVDVACDQRFYLFFRESFPACAHWMNPMVELEPDEMAILLTEERIKQFDLQASYSVQWLMGQLGGTKASMLPKITIPVKQDPSDILVSSPFMSDVVGLFRKARITPMWACDSLSFEQIGLMLTHAKLLICEQSAVSVLAVAMGIPTVEITKTASQRPFLGLQHYVQVSRLTPQSFFIDALVRGVECMQMRDSSWSAVSNVAETLAVCRQG